MHVPRTVIPLL